MCMYTNQLEPKIAEKNILVMKYTVGIFSLFYTLSGFMGFKYLRFFKYKTGILSVQSEYYSTPGNVVKLINDGFHSYMEYSSGNIGHGFDKYFIIPAGAKYYEGQDNAYHVRNQNSVRVSNQIIYIGRVNRLNRWIAKVFYHV